MWDLVGNPGDRFSHNEAPILLIGFILISRLVIPIIIDGTGPLSPLSVLNSYMVGVTSSTFNETIFIHDKAMRCASSELSPYC